MRGSALVSAIVVGLLLCGPVSQASAASLEEQVTKLRAQIRKDVGVKLPTVPVPANNPQTRDKVKLGEALFFDPNLSGCAEVACATCHLPEKGFSDGKEVSPGCKGTEGRRNSATETTRPRGPAHSRPRSKDCVTSSTSRAATS